VGSDEVIVLDTHFWVWFHLGDERLTEFVASKIGRDTILSAASIWEVMYLIEKGRLLSDFTSEETVRRWLASSPMRVAPVDARLSRLPWLSTLA
jgi:PIN domain nuclease of toxin-antitoxin system